MPGRESLPSTLKRSPAKAQRMWIKKVGDHWEPKRHRGPSDPRARKPAREARTMGKKELARAIARKQ